MSTPLSGCVQLTEQDYRRALARKYQLNPVVWLLGSDIAPQQVRTRDEHDPEIAAKPFPDKPYIREMVRLWQTGKMNLWEKSRQVMASWTLCALYLWDAQFGDNRLNFIQSKKEEDSDALLQRCFFIYERQDDWLRALYPAEYSYCHIEFAYTDRKSDLSRSRIWGIPQGGDVIRQHTGSGLLIDEAGFHPDLEKAIGSAQPMLKGGGRVDVVSSAEPGYFEQLVNDKIK